MRIKKLTCMENYWLNSDIIFQIGIKFFRVWLYIRRNSIEANKSWWENHGVLKYSTFE
jgi:hypothetical protein